MGKMQWKKLSVSQWHKWFKERLNGQDAQELSNEKRKKQMHFWRNCEA